MNSQISLVGWGGYNSATETFPKNAGSQAGFVTSAQLDYSGLNTYNDSRCVWSNPNASTILDVETAPYLSYIIETNGQAILLDKFVWGGMALLGTAKVQIRWSIDNYSSSLGELTSNSSNYTLTSVNLGETEFSGTSIEFRAYFYYNASTVWNSSTGPYASVDGTPPAYAPTFGENVCIWYKNTPTGIWNGSASNDWQTSANWDDNIVPDNTVDVTIQAAKSNYPIIDNLGNQSKSLLIEDGAKLTVSTGGSFTVNGDLTVGDASSSTFEGDGGTINITGQFILNSNSAATITNCSITCASASLNATSTVTFDGASMDINNWNYGNLVLNGTGTMKITGNTITPTLCNNLTINNTGNILKIPENKSLTVNGTVTNNVGTTGLVVESSSSGDGSLIISTSNVNANIKRYLTGDRWHYISSPVNNASSSIFNSDNLLWWDATMEWAGTGDFDPWKSYLSANLENAHGYAYYNSETTLDYNDYINVGDYSVTLYKSSTGDADDQGWNLIGNPYTSILDWDALVTDGSFPAGAENAIYLFDDDDASGSQSNYRYYIPSTGGTYGIGTNDATGSIPLGQAFFVKTNTDNVNVTIKKSYRTHSTQEFYKNSSQFLIKLSLIGLEYSDQMIYRFVSDATTEFDALYDARKLFSEDENIPQIYSISNINKTKIAINSIPEINDNTILNIGFIAEKGKYELLLNEFSILDNSIKNELYLYDSVLDIYIDINETKKYSFIHPGGEVSTRFILCFNKELSNISLQDNIMIKVFPNPAKDYININSDEKYLLKNIEIISLSGKVCFSSKVNEEKTQINISEFTNGIYFAKLTLSDGYVYNKRIIVNN